MRAPRFLSLVVVAAVLASAAGGAAATTVAGAESPDRNGNVDVAVGGQRGADVGLPAAEDGVAAVGATATVGTRERRQVEAAVDVEAPETSDEFLASFRELSGRDSLAAYSEFEVLRTQAIVAVQSGEFESADRERMRAVLRTLVRFDVAYRTVENGDLTEGLRVAEETRSTLSTLESADGAQYSSLAGVALDRFFRSLGERFEERSREGISTPERIAALERAGEAYRLGGESERFAEVSVQAERLASAYERDREEMNESVTAAQSFTERCGGTCESPVGAVAAHTLGVFGLYSDARAVNTETSEAVRIAQSHNLGERTEEIRAVSEDSSATLLSLALGAALLLFAYAVALAIPAMYVTSRMSVWATDRQAASVGSVLTPRPAEVRTDDGE